MYDQMIEAPMLVPTTVTSCTSLSNIRGDRKSRDLQFEPYEVTWYLKVEFIQEIAQICS